MTRQPVTEMRVYANDPWRCPPYEVYQNLSHGGRCEVVKKGFEKLRELQEQAQQLSRDLESLVWGME